MTAISASQYDRLAEVRKMVLELSGEHPRHVACGASPTTGAYLVAGVCDTQDTRVCVKDASRRGDECSLCVCLS
jgi:hypothetical protein